MRKQRVCAGAWTSDGSAMPEWLALGLRSDAIVNGFIVRHAEAGGEASYFNTEQFRVQSGTSFTGPWSDEAVVDNSAQDAVTNLSYVTSKTLRFVRLYVTDAGIDNHVRLPEFEVGGTAGGGGGGGGGGGQTVAEDFDSMPAWSSSFDSSWGSAASWAIAGGGQSGNALEAARGAQGSSAKVKVYNISSNTSYTISVWIRCPSHGSAYWAECAGSHTASDFDTNGGAWTMIKKFANSGPNGNGNVWTQYSVSFRAARARESASASSSARRAEEVRRCSGTLFEWSEPESRACSLTRLDMVTDSEVFVDSLQVGA